MDFNLFGGIMKEDERTLKIKGEGMARGQEVTIKEIPMNKIKIGRNSRLSTSKEDLSGLMQSINSTGLLEPIGVVKKGDGYEIAYGNRRFMAFSKLGLHSIPAVIHEAKDASKIDVMNLAENVQRRNISLAEIGRYVKILEGEGMNIKELAIRLGAPVNYINSCIIAYKEIPEDFRDDLQIQITGQKPEAGKISLTAAKAIINAQKQHGFPKVVTKELFQAAKQDRRFHPENVPKYVAAIKRGSKDPIGSVRNIKTFNIKMMMSESEYDSLMNKHVLNGPYNSITALIKAILRGEKSLTMKIIE